MEDINFSKTLSNNIFDNQSSVLDRLKNQYTVLFEVYYYVNEMQRVSFRTVLIPEASIKYKI